MNLYIYEEACSGSLDYYYFVCLASSLKTNVCPKPFSSYRALFNAPVDQWATVRVPFDEFKGHGPGATENPFDTSALRRIGVVAIGREMDVTLAVSGVRFYRKKP